MDGPISRETQLFAFFWLAHREGPPGCEHDQWTVAKISHGMRLGCALLECLATRRGHKRFGLELKPVQCSCLIDRKSRRRVPARPGSMQQESHQPGSGRQWH